MEDGTLAGVVALAVNRDGVVCAGAFGKRGVGSDVDMTGDTIFRIASMTKPITSVAAMQLVEEGLVGLDDPAEKYLPALGEKRVLPGSELTRLPSSARRQGPCVVASPRPSVQAPASAPAKSTPPRSRRDG